MPELILRFHNELLESFDWTIAQDEQQEQNIVWQAASEAGLGEIIASHAMPAVMVIPQQCVFMTRFEFPGKATRQILSSIEFQIEDQLGDDIDLQHVATGEVSGDSVPIVVLKKSIMHRCQQLQQKYNITLTKIIPEIFLCPWYEGQDEVSIIESHDGLIIRTGYYQGFKCQTGLLESMLNQLNRNEPIETVKYYFEDRDTFEACRTKEFESQQAQPTHSSLADAQISGFDLRQREFKQTSVWGSAVRPWKWVGLVMAIFLVVFIYNQISHQHDLKTQLTKIKSQQYQVVKAHLPTNTSENDNLKKKLIQVIQQHKASQGDSDFLSQLVVFTQAKQAFKSITITKIGFQKSRLHIDISSTKLNDMEALVKSLESKVSDVRLENLTIKPEFVSGRLVLSGTGGG